jgi:4-aminobutyrate aminotransferase-like enzyme
MLGKLLAMQEKHTVIGDVRGNLLLGLESSGPRHEGARFEDQTKALFQGPARALVMSYL